MKIISEIIKKIVSSILRILGRSLEALIILLIIFIFLIRSQWFQTYFGSKVTYYYSLELGTEVSVNRVKLNGIEYLELYDFIIRDLKGDTLLYAPMLNARLKDFSVRDKFAVLESINLKNTRIKLQQYKGNEETNAQFLLDYFNKPKNNEVFTLKIQKIGLDNTHFSFHDGNFKEKEYGIDYKHIELTKLNGSIMEFRNRNNMTSVDLESISFSERSGFELENLDCHFVINPRLIKIEGLHLKTNNSSIISKGIAMNYHDKEDLKDFINAVVLKGSIQKSKFNIKDISYFAPKLQYIDRAINFSGDINGTVNNLFIDNLALDLSSESYFKGNVEFKGLSDIENCLIYLDIEKCQTSKIDLERIDLSGFGMKNNLKLPNELAPMGIVKIVGSIEGFYNDFSARFNIITDVGKIDGDINCSLDEKNMFSYIGNLNTIDFDGGKVFQNKKLGKFSSQIQLDGKGVTLENMDLSIDGKFNKFNYSGYLYDDITVEGRLREKAFDGKLFLFDKNIDLIFEGDFDLAESPVLFDFNINVQKAHLYDLNVINERESSSICFDLFASGFGTNFDDFSGMVELKNISYYEEGKDYYFDSILFDSQSNKFRHNIELYSKFAEFKMGGQFSLDTLALNLYALGSKIVPSILPNNLIYETSHEDFVFEMKINDLSKLTQLFVPEFSVSPNTKLNCSFNSEQELVKLYAESDWIVYNGIKYANLRLDTTKKLINIDTSYVFNLFIDTVYIKPDVYLQNLNLNSKAYADNLDLLFHWAADDSSYNGEIRSNGRVYGNSKFDFDIYRSEIYSKKTGIWKIKDDFHLAIDSSSINISEFSIANQHQSVLLKGIISENSTDKLQIQLDNIDLAVLNDFISAKNMEIGGILNFKGDMSDVYSNMYFDSQSSIDNISINEYTLGDFNLHSKWNSNEKRIEMDGKLIDVNDHTGFEIKKSYYYIENELDKLRFNFSFKGFDIEFANAFLPEDVMSELKGDIKGKIKMKGTFENPILKGRLKLNNGSLKLDMFNTTYQTEGEIVIQKDMIEINGIPIRDKFGVNGLLVGSFYHQNFSRYNYDLYASFEDPFLVMNTTYKMNPLYYGNAFITGDVMVEYDTINKLRVNVEAAAEKGTDISLPLYGSEEVILQDFITFNSDSVKTEDYEVNLEDISMNLSLDLKEEAEIQLVFDEIVGDAMKGKGIGHIDMEIDQYNEFSMYGQYTISEGSYLFTLKDFINKKFNVKPGGTISWYGDPYKADLDLVSYYPLKASLYNIMPESEREEWKQKTDIDVEMHLSENLFNPDIEFDIILPRANENARTALHNLVSSDQEMNRQVFSLLILNKFITQKQNISNSNYNLSFVGSTTSEMLSSQLSNMISKFSDDFDIGFNYRPGDEISNDEVSVAMSTQQFNDRLTIQTNLGVSQGNKSNQNPNSFIGDVDVEYKINRQGNLRVHAFNESNEYDISNLEQSRYTQGLGAFYKQNFNNLGELICEMGNLFKRRSKECDSCEEKTGRKNCK